MTSKELDLLEEKFEKNESAKFSIIYSPTLDVLLAHDIEKDFERNAPFLLFLTKTQKLEPDARRYINRLFLENINDNYEEDNETISESMLQQDEQDEFEASL